MMAKPKKRVVKKRKRSDKNHVSAKKRKKDDYRGSYIHYVYSNIPQVNR